MLLNLLSEVGKLFFFSFIAYSGIKTIRSISRSIKRVSCGDLYYLCLFSILFGSLFYIDNFVINIFTVLLVSVLIMIYCIDAGLCATYNFPLNFSTLKMSYANRLTLKNTALSFVKARPRLYALMLLLVITVVSCYLFEAPEPIQVVLGIGVVIFSTVIITKSKINYLTFLAWFFLFLACCFLLLFGFSNTAFRTGLDYLFSGLGIFSIAYALTNFFFKFDKVSNIKTIFFPNTLKVTTQEFSEKEQEIIKNCQSEFTASPMNGQLAGCNVVFIAFESVGLTHLQSFNRNKSNLAVTPFIEKMLGNSIFSTRHFCLEPSTFSAIKNLYFSSFVDRGASEYIESLNQKKYETIALHLSGEPVTEKIYNDLGFKHFFSGKTIASEKKGDHRMLDFVDEIKPIIGEKSFFLHIFNSNTHMNYYVNDRSRYNRYNNLTEKGRYYNAIEECDQILSDTISKIYAFSPPEKTIIVLVGDHGESFGFFDYLTHNSSVVNEQILSPFLIYHPSLQQQEISFSTHHDVLPTLFDLLGHPVPENIMGTTVLGNYPYPYAFMASTIKSGKFPACFGFFHEDRKYLVDLLNAYFYMLDENDNILEKFTGERKSHILSFLAQGMQARNLI